MSWGDLLIRYPDREEKPLRTFKGLGGKAGEWQVGGLLRIDICVTGLRIGVSRLFLPHIFVPWTDIHIVRRAGLLPNADLVFGDPAVGTVTVESYIADKLARASSDHWPESGPFKPMSAGGAFIRTFLEWLAATTVYGLFFSLVPRLIEGFNNPNLSPTWMTFLFPALVVGFICVKRFNMRVRN